MPATGDPNHPAMLATVADRAHALFGGTLTTDAGSRPLGPSDVAVVVSHNAQASVPRSAPRSSSGTGSAKAR